MNISNVTFFLAYAQCQLLADTIEEWADENIDTKSIYKKKAKTYIAQFGRESVDMLGDYVDGTLSAFNTNNTTLWDTLISNSCRDLLINETSVFTEEAASNIDMLFVNKQTIPKWKFVNFMKEQTIARAKLYRCAYLDGSFNSSV